jgi:hypothetical protein
MESKKRVRAKKNLLPGPKRPRERKRNQRPKLKLKVKSKNKLQGPRIVKLLRILRLLIRLKKILKISWKREISLLRKLMLSS